MKLTEIYHHEPDGSYVYQAEDGDPLLYVLCKRVLNRGGEISYKVGMGRMLDSKLTGLHHEDGKIELHYMRAATEATGERSGFDEWPAETFDDNFSLEKVDGAWELKYASK